MQDTQLFEGYEDCEIRSLSFDYPNLILNIFDPEEMAYYRFEFKDVEFFLFETNHIQNVIRSIDTYDNISEAMKSDDFVKFARSRNLIEEISEQFGNYKICYINPIAGGDCVIVYLEMKLSE